MKTLFLILLFPLFTFAQYPDFIAVTKRGTCLIQIKKQHVSCFINKHWALAKRVQKKYKIPAGLFLAQLALESGWGRSSCALYRNNYLGIRFEGVYATFESIEDCVRIYGNTLTNKCYKGLEPRTIDGWLYALQECGYFKSREYKSKIKRIIKTYKIPLNL